MFLEEDVMCKSLKKFVNLQNDMKMNTNNKLP